jgi:hypothetical protein
MLLSELLVIVARVVLREIEPTPEVIEWAKARVEESKEVQ